VVRVASHGRNYIEVELHFRKTVDQTQFSLKHFFPYFLSWIIKSNPYQKTPISTLSEDVTYVSYERQIMR